MPKGKTTTNRIPKIYKRNAEKIALFFFVKAQKQIVPTVTDDQAIWNFFKFADIDDWDIDCARVTYSNLQKEYLEDKRT